MGYPFTRTLVAARDIVLVPLSYIGVSPLRVCVMTYQWSLSLGPVATVRKSAFVLEI